MLVLRMLYNGVVTLNEAFEKDKRITSYPLVGKPWPMIAIVGLYLLTVLKWGPKFMANRNPYKIDGVLRIYNVLQIALNAFIFYEGMKYTFLRDDYNITCEKYDPNDSRPIIMKAARPTYLYVLSKYLDLLETVFFMMRKKFTQVTFLHVYHHAIMIVAVYIYCTFLFSSHFGATGVINSFIHVCMYTYYFVAAAKLNINLEPWKRILTAMQILQFLLMAIHLTLPLLNNWCKLPVFWLLIELLQHMFMIALFSNFYYRAYILKGSKKREHDVSKLK